MKTLLQRLLVLLAHRSGGAGSVALGGFLDSLVQTFENCRPGLSDAMIARGGPEVERFFVELYEKEMPRLEEAVRVQAPYLEGEKRAKFLSEADALVRRVLIPGYARLALTYTPRERNNFFLAKEGAHGFERVGWAVAGMLLGAFCVAVPWIPIYAKEWVLLFVIGGFFFPTIRRFLSIRTYEAELNQLVARADRELGRIDLAYLTSGHVAAGHGFAELATPAPVAPSEEIDPPGVEGSRRAARPRTKEGD